MTKEDLENLMHEADLICRPYILFVNPSEEAKFRQALKDAGVEDIVLLHTENFIETGKVVAIDRKKLEEWTYFHGYELPQPTSSEGFSR